MQCLSNSYLRFISLDEILELDTYVFPAPLTPMTTITTPVMFSVSDMNLIDTQKMKQNIEEEK